ncbi:hypothetical protein L9F63_013331, partial [Diploptera punctata]
LSIHIVCLYFEIREIYIDYCIVCTQKNIVVSSSLITIPPMPTTSAKVWDDQ